MGSFLRREGDVDRLARVAVHLEPFGRRQEVDLNGPTTLPSGFDRLGPVGADVAAKFRGGWPGVMKSFANMAGRCHEWGGGAIPPGMMWLARLYQWPGAGGDGAMVCVTSTGRPASRGTRPKPACMKLK